jgi:cell division protein FtsB
MRQLVVLEQALHSFREALAISGVRKALWASLLLLGFLIFFETYTQYFAYNGLATRLKIIQDASQAPVSPDQLSRLSKIKDQLILEVEKLQDERRHPELSIEAAFVRFLKGAYIVFPLGWLVLKMTFRFALRAEVPQKQIVLWLGFIVFSFIVWAATLLGLVSVVWNRSSSLVVSWFLFPFLASMTLLAVAVWISILRGSLPNEKRA